MPGVLLKWRRTLKFHPYNTSEEEFTRDESSKIPPTVKTRFWREVSGLLEASEKKKVFNGA